MGQRELTPCRRDEEKRNAGLIGSHLQGHREKQSGSFVEKAASSFRSPQGALIVWLFYIARQGCLGVGALIAGVF